VVPNKKSTKMLPKRERRSGKGKTGKQYLVHISARIQVTTIIIEILLVTLKKGVGKFI
jgi:hypothetical protein